MGWTVSGKMKKILQSPTPESNMVDDTTLETMNEPNWSMNLRICGMINSKELNGSEIVKAIKRRINPKSIVTQRLSLDLLETIAMNCDKEELILNLLDKCKQSLSIIKGIVESTTNDEVTLFEALYLNDELQQAVSKYEELEAAQKSGEQQPQNADTAKDDTEVVQNPNKLPERSESDDSEESEAVQNLERKLHEKFNALGVDANDEDRQVETIVEDSTKENDAGSSSKRNNE